MVGSKPCTQLLRRAQDRGDAERPVSRADAWHDHPRRRKYLNDDGTPVTGRPEPISYYYKDGGGIGAGDHGGARPARGRRCVSAVIGLGSGIADLCIGRRARTESSSRSTSPMVDTARRSEIFQLHPEVRTGRQAGDRRCAADFREKTRRRLRPHHRGCLFVGRDPDPSGDRGSDGDLQGKARPAGRRRNACVEPASSNSPASWSASPMPTT